MARKSSTRTPICGFPPIAALDARVLVLGSMPSVASLAKQQYYGHPQNAFWPIMGRLFGARPEMPYDRRKETLCERGVAVWDVLRECHRDGSLDAAICARSEVANDFQSFFERQAGINIVFFNGQKAETAFRRHVLQEVMELRPDLRYVRLPSTSPANAGMSFDEKLAAWRAVADAL
jgi:hypoxanthine-DNA glycosylase